MAAEWYYTTNKQQMGPVSWGDLCELAETGILKPNDLVWTEGMAEWLKAIQQNGLFAPDAGRRDAIADLPPSARRSRRRADEDNDDEDEEVEESRRKSRRRKAERTKMATGLKVGLILGGILCALLFIACAGGLMVLLAVRNSGGSGTQSYTVFNLPQQQVDDRTFTFQQGRRVIITVTNITQFPNTDVDLYVLRGRQQNANAPNFVALDERLPMVDRNCRVEFIVPATDVYHVQVRNLGPGMANSCAVNITIE